MFAQKSNLILMMFRFDKFSMIVEREKTFLISFHLEIEA